MLYFQKRLCWMAHVHSRVAGLPASQASALAAWGESWALTLTREEKPKPDSATHILLPPCGEHSLVTVREHQPACCSQPAVTVMESSNVQGKKVAIVGGGLVGNAACLLFDCWEVREWLLSKVELECEGLWKSSSTARRLLWALQT